MANANVARGLVPYKHTSGAHYNGAANVYYVPATYGTAIYLGDPVIPSGTSDANGIPGVTVATAGSSNYLIGAMVGIVAQGDPIVAVTRDLPIYHQASTAQYILVADDPDLLFMVQENGNMGANASSNNVNLVSGSGSTNTGWSGWQLNSSTVATTNTLQMRVVRLLQESDNVVGTNAKWLCRVNLHSLTNTTGI